MLRKIDHFHERDCNVRPIACHHWKHSAVFIGDSITREMSEEASSMYGKVSFHWNPTPTVQDLRVLRKQNPSTMWVGGNAIHLLLRKVPKDDPVSAYTQRVLPIFEYLYNSSTTTIFIGPTPLDDALFMHPAKHDWREFHDTRLLFLWDDIGARQARRFGVPYFSTAEGVARHPRCRCDGMHFASQFIEWNCSKARVWVLHMCSFAASMAKVFSSEGNNYASVAVMVN